MLKLLTRSEEFVLLAVWRLQSEAYSLAIQDEISKLTGYSWSLGSIFTPLERLQRKRLLTSTLSDSTPDRGGRKKRIYQLTMEGKKALDHLHSIEAAMWEGLPSFAILKV
ncbi:MAG: PadR family transcriptional regulator [Bacteroidetes bacterium]|nr:PadR family transcriptional regulator [Bacteroidota bacterium]